MKLAILTLLLIFVYEIAIYVLAKIGSLTKTDFINNTTIFFGWLITLSIAWLHLKKTREDNRVAKKEEIRKALEINAFREINKSITGFSNIISTVATPYMTWVINLKLHLEDSKIFKFNKMEIDRAISQHAMDILKGHTDFLISIEANEIAIIQFSHYRTYIGFKVTDVGDSLRKFQGYLLNKKPEELITVKGCNEFEAECHKIHEELLNIQMYLFDYRIILMNSLLGEVFDNTVPSRHPMDPKYKILTEIAIKEEVEKESKTRDVKAISKVASPSKN